MEGAPRHLIAGGGTGLAGQYTVEWVPWHLIAVGGIELAGD